MYAQNIYTSHFPCESMPLSPIIFYVEFVSLVLICQAIIALTSIIQIFLIAPCWLLTC